MFGRTSEQEVFEEDLAANVKFIQHNLDLLDDDEDKAKIRDIANWYDEYGTLSHKQSYVLMRAWQKLQELGGSDPEPSRGRLVVKETTTSTAHDIAITAVVIDGKKFMELFDFWDRTNLLQDHELSVLTEQFDPIPNRVIRFKRVPPTARYPGSVLLTSILATGKTVDRINQIAIAQIHTDGRVTFGKHALERPEFQQWLKKFIEETIISMKLYTRN